MYQLKHAENRCSALEFRGRLITVASEWLTEHHVLASETHQTNLNTILDAVGKVAYILQLEVPSVLQASAVVPPNRTSCPS